MDYTIQLGPKVGWLLSVGLSYWTLKMCFLQDTNAHGTKKVFKPFTIELKNILYFMPWKAYSS
jgi:hypothetical protein